MSGLIQTLDVSSDDDRLLDLVLRLPWEWDHGGATHYRVDQKDGADKLTLGHKGTVLPYPLTTPEMVFSFVRGWLNHARYGESPDTDGSVSQGWRCTKHWEDFISVTAEWIVYGK